MALPPAPPLWWCPRCGAPLVSANLWHSCVTMTPAQTFAKSRPGVLEVFQAYAEQIESVAAERGARIRVIAQKTRVTIVARVRFAGAQPRRDHVRASFALRRQLASPRVLKVETYGPRWVVHTVHLASVADIDDELTGWLRESVGVGLQDDLYEWVPGSLD